MNGHVKIHLQQLDGSYDRPGSINTEVTIDCHVESMEEVEQAKLWANKALALKGRSAT